MKLIAQILIAVVALEHIYILWIEMFAWTTKGKATFKSLPEHLFEPTKTLAANQGLYVAMFFLGCVVVAGLYGGLTASKGILIKQFLPAAIALVAVLVWM
jgi:putative membrane protein